MYIQGDIRVTVSLQAKKDGGEWGTISSEKCLEHQYPAVEAQMERAKDAWEQSSVMRDQTLRVHVEYPKA